MLDRMMQLSDNARATDEYRAVSYLAVRYAEIYARTASEHSRNASLMAVDVRQSPLTGVRTVVEVIFSSGHRQP